MIALLSFIPMTLMLCMFAWYLRLGGKWGLNITPSWKLSFAYAGLATLIAIVVGTILRLIEWSPGIVIGTIGQFCFGSWFFGRYLKAPNGDPVAFIGGAKLMAIAMLLFLVTGAMLMFVGMQMIKHG